MSIDDGQKNRMILGGTQGLPAPGTDVAMIKWESKKDKTSNNRLVCITHEKSPSHAVVWSVRLGDLMAIEAKKSVDAKKKKIKWYVGKDVAQALEKNGELTGIAYVREEAQTLVRLEHGVSVINSVQVAAGLPVLTRESDDEFEIKCVRC